MSLCLFLYFFLCRAEKESDRCKHIFPFSSSFLPSFFLSQSLLFKYFSSTLQHDSLLSSFTTFTLQYHSDYLHRTYKHFPFPSFLSPPRVPYQLQPCSSYRLKVAHSTTSLGLCVLNNPSLLLFFQSHFYYYSSPSSYIFSFISYFSSSSFCSCLSFVSSFYSSSSSISSLFSRSPFLVLLLLHLLLACYYPGISL